MKPLADRVVCRQFEREEKTQGGLILVDNEKPNLAKVLHIGPDVKEIFEGDVIVLSGKWFTNFKHPVTKEELLIVNEADVLGILNGE
jgi:co-chaperonin GroES (HSP10)